MSVFGPYQAVVVLVHDGDTVNLIVSPVNQDFGFGIAVKADLTLACRVYGINAPELKTPEGKVARDFAKTLLKPGDAVAILSHGWDKYGGRFDGEIILSDGRNFGTEMLAAGHAVPFMV